ncbi:MAG: hypothetical protein M1457_06295 [bacterium]|nr:hypothetical protein [bacterium]
MSDIKTAPSRFVSIAGRMALRWMRGGDTPPDGTPSRFDVLEVISLSYILLPNLIFLFGYLKSIYGIPLCAILIAAGYYSLTRRGGTDYPPALMPEKIPGKGLARGWRNSLAGLNFLVLLGVIAFILAYLGFAGYTYQDGDYRKHNAFVRDLMENTWPLAYQQTGPEFKPGILVTYIGYYLPSAVVGKLLGWTAALHFSYLWAVLGVLLTVLWFMRLTRHHTPLAAVAVLFFGGLDILAPILLRWEPIHLQWPKIGPETIDFWIFRYSPPADRAALNTVYYLFASNMTFLATGPHHVLPTWLCALMLVSDAVQRRTSQRSVLLWSLVPIYSAFTAIGVFPFVLVAFWESRLRRAFSFQNLVAAVLLLGVMGLYFITNNANLPKGFIWNFQDLSKTWYILVVFYIVEFGIYAYFCPRARPIEGRLNRKWFYMALACFLLCPWWRMGYNNDFGSKTIIPGQIIYVAVLIASIQTAWSRLERRHFERIRAIPLVFLLMVGGLAGFQYFLRGYTPGFHPKPTPLTATIHVDQMGPRDVAAQLFSDGEGFFWRRLAKRAKYQKPAVNFLLNEWDFTRPQSIPGQWATQADTQFLTPDGLVLTVSKPCIFFMASGVRVDTSLATSFRLLMTVTDAAAPEMSNVVCPIRLYWDEKSTLGDLPRRIDVNRSCSLGELLGVRQLNVGVLKSWHQPIQSLALETPAPPKGHQYTMIIRKIQIVR